MKIKGYWTILLKLKSNGINIWKKEGYIMSNNCEIVKQNIRVVLLNEKGNPLKLQPRDGQDASTVDSGYEDLDLREDQEKIHLYQTTEHLDLWNDKKFKVIKRSFMPCRPVALFLYLQEE